MQKRKRYMFPYIHGETQLYSVVFGMISYSVSPKALVGGAVLTVNTWPETFTRTVCMRRPMFPRMLDCMIRYKIHDHSHVSIRPSQIQPDRKSARARHELTATNFKLFSRKPIDRLST